MNYHLLFYLRMIVYNIENNSNNNHIDKLKNVAYFSKNISILSLI
jgi:hypothetical protein